MQTVVTIVHVLVSVFMILVILLQAGKDPGMGGISGGGGGSGSAFGGRGSQTLLEKVTIGCATLFMLTSIALALISSKSTSMVLQRAQERAESSQKKDASKATPPAALPANPAPTNAAPAAPAPAAPAK